MDWGGCARAPLMNRPPLVKSLRWDSPKFFMFGDQLGYLLANKLTLELNIRFSLILNSPTVLELTSYSTEMSYQKMYAKPQNLLHISFD